MAIEFLQAQKKQKYLILILALLIFGILFFVWFGFFKTAAPASPLLPSTTVQQKIEINWSVLQDKKLEALKVFEQIPALKGEAGRKNPFISY